MDEKCSHQWEMANVSYGFIITEKCFHCEKIATYFTFEQKPPLEEYREGEIFPPDDSAEEWLKLLDYDPDQVVGISSFRQGKAQEERLLQQII